VEIIKGPEKSNGPKLGRVSEGERTGRGHRKFGRISSRRELGGTLGEECLDQQTKKGIGLGVVKKKKT